jgi:hypothetical protein
VSYDETATASPPLDAPGEPEGDEQQPGLVDVLVVLVDDDDDLGLAGTVDPA